MKRPTSQLVCVVSLLLLVTVPGLGTAGDRPKNVAGLIGKLEKADGRLQAVQDLAELGPQAAPAVPDLIKLLHVKDEELRVNTVLALGHIGKKAVPPLVQAVASRDDDVRFYAVWGLGLVGKEAQEATPAVIEALADPVASVRRKAGFTLGRLDAKADTIVPPLVKGLDDADEDVREAVADTLTRLGEPAVPGLTGAIQGGPVRVRRHAVLIVGAIGPDAKAAIPALGSLLLGKELDATALAANALAGIGKAAIPALGDGLRDERPHIQQISFTALARLGSAASPAFADALKSLANKHVSLRIELAGQIIESGLPVDEAMPVLLAAMKEKDAGMRLRATQWLQRTHQSTRVSDKAVVLALAAVLQDEDARVGHTAADTLQKLGASAGPATPQLQKALASSTPGTRGCAFLALKTVDSDFEHTARKALAASRDNASRIHIADLIVTTGTNVEEALPVLLAGLKEKDLGLRVQAARALGDREVEKVVPILIEGLGSALTTPPGAEAYHALVTLGQHAGAAAPAMAKFLDDPEPHHRHLAALALGKIGGDSAVVVPAIAKLLAKEDEGQVREAAARALSLHGDRAVPVLVDLLKPNARDRYQAIRLQALNSVATLQGDRIGALPLLAPLARSKDMEQRRAAIHAAVGLGKQGLPLLVDALRDEYGEISGLAAHAIRSMGLDPAMTTPTLLEAAVKDPYIGSRHFAVQALVGQGEDGVKPLLDAFAKEKDGNFRSQAVTALFAAGSTGQTVAASALKHDDSKLRHLILASMKKDGYRAKEAIPVLIACLKDDSATVRALSADVLGNIGMDAGAAIAALTIAQDDADPTVRSSVHNALKRIRTPGK